MLTLNELVGPFALQPPEVQREARVYIETVDGLVAAKASYRDILSVDTGETVEALVITPERELVKVPSDIEDTDDEDEDDDDTCVWNEELACLHPDWEDCMGCPFDIISSDEAQP